MTIGHLIECLNSKKVVLKDKVRPNDYDATPFNYDFSVLLIIPSIFNNSNNANKNL